MTQPPSRIRHPAAIAGVAVLLALPALAAEENEAVLGQIVDLNKRALVAYDALDMETASALLRQALNLCKHARLGQHPTTARTHLHLGVVYISGLKFPELGLAEFRAALAIDPKIQLTKSLSNPEVQAAFEEALWWETGPGGGPKQLPFPTGQEAATPATPEPPPGMDRIIHPLVTRANQGQAIEIKAKVPATLAAAKVVLAYMAQDANDFLAREMQPVVGAKGWFHASIPTEATRKAWVAYYIEVQDADDQTLAENGSPEAPHQITLVPENARDDLTPAPSPGPGRAKTPAAPGRGLWLVLAMGGGGGYHWGSPEMNPKDAHGDTIDVTGFGAAELLHVAPEIGYFQWANIVLSVQGRFQFITGTQSVHIGQKTYHPAAMAFAGLAKLTWLLARPGKRIQPFASAMLGAGQIRHNVTTPESAQLTGCSTRLTCRDTVLGGLGLLGAGAGFRFRLLESFGFYAAVNLLAGMPHLMVNADVNAGLVFVR
jgi:hypothetical protein